MRSLRLVLLCAAVNGCAETTVSNDPFGEDERSEVASSTSLLDNPPEIYVNEKGVRFRLVGPAPVGVVPRGGVEVPGPADGSARAPIRTKLTVDELAEQMRPILLMGGRWEYIGEEPAYDLAESILRDEPMAESVEPREGRAIVGDTCGSGTGPCDDRYHVTGTTPGTTFYRPTLFIEHGCSATMIDRSTAVTAAHCMYNTSDEHWYVTDGVTCTSSSESASSNTEDRNTASPTTTSNCLPRIATGMSNTGVQGTWLTCYNVTIIKEFRDASGGDQSSWPHDYAVIDFNTSFCSNKFPGDNSGWRGTWRATAADFSAGDSLILGYPHRSSPGNPDNSFGGAGSAFPIRLSPTDCSLLSGAQGTASDSFSPCTSAMLAGATAGGNTFFIDPLGNGSWEVGTTTLDTTTGQSGSAYILYGSPTSNRTVPSTAGNQYLVAIHRGVGSTGWNCGRKWDTALSNFVTNNSDFPTVN